MRRIIIISTGIAVLVAATAAYAALNTYKANITVSPAAAGSPTSPVPVAVTETYRPMSATTGDRADPLTDIKTSIYGLVSNPSAFPTCNGNKMSVMKSDSFCPPKALVATGPVNVLLGGADLTKSGAPCNPFLHVWNGGGGTLWFFFTTSARYSCGSLHTGDTQAYEGHVKRQGTFLVNDVPLPTYLSIAVAHHQGLYSSLLKEVLTYRKLTTVVHGKTVGFTSSVGCRAGKRPFTISFTAISGAGSPSETKTVSGSSPC
jgi:hypothetical protein